jgi:hypothetical protein
VAASPVAFNFQDVGGEKWGDTLTVTDIERCVLTLQTQTQRTWEYLIPDHLYRYRVAALYAPSEA